MKYIHYTYNKIQQNAIINIMKYNIYTIHIIEYNNTDNKYNIYTIQIIKYTTYTIIK